MIRHPPRSTLFPYPPLSRSTVLSGGCRPLVGTHHCRVEPCSTAFHESSMARLYKALCNPRSAAWRSSASSINRRSEEHTSELQSQSNLVCRLLLEKKKKYHS